MFVIKDFEQSFIAIFLNLSNCSFHLIIAFNRASILALSLLKTHLKNRFTIAIADELLFPDRYWVTFDS